MRYHPSRREFLVGGVSAAATLLPGTLHGQATRPTRQSSIISLNTSTLRGHKVPLPELIDIAARAGYGGIEPWVDEIDRYVTGGGSLRDLSARIRDHGLAVTGAIAFYEWMVDDETARAKAIDQARHHLERLAEIGGTRMAAPPAGDVAHVSLLAAAERYRRLLEAAEPFGVWPALEIWGFASNLSRLGQAALVAIEADHPRATILPDIYHLYKGGSGFNGLARLSGTLYGGFHLNDFPASPPREALKDADRIYPGDGVAPLPQILRDLRRAGYHGPFSIELFNPEYWKRDPAEVAATALRKTQAVFAKTA